MKIKIDFKLYILNNLKNKLTHKIGIWKKELTRKFTNILSN